MGKEEISRTVAINVAQFRDKISLKGGGIDVIPCPNGRVRKWHS
jgi:hypothetical protein